MSESAAARYLSTTAFADAALPDIVRACLADGIDGLELSANVGLDGAGREAIARARERGMRFLVHNYFPRPDDPFVLNLASDEPGIRTRSEAHCRGALELSAELGAPFYSVHAGFAARLHPAELGRPLTAAPRIPRAAAYATFVEVVGRLCEVASAHGVRLLVENNVVAPFNLVDGRNDLLLLATAEEVSRFCADVAHETLGVLVDVGHVNVSARTLGFDRHEFLRAVAGRIGAFHLSDNDGMKDDNRPFNGHSWFMESVRRLPSAALVAEVVAAPPAARRACWQAMKREES